MSVHGWGDRFYLRIHMSTDNAPAGNSVFVPSGPIFPCGVLGEIHGYMLFRQPDDAAPGADLDVFLTTDRLTSGGPADDIIVSSIVDEILGGTLPNDGETTTPEATFDLENWRHFDSLRVVVRHKTDVPVGVRLHTSIVLWGWVAWDGARLEMTGRGLR